MREHGSKSIGKKYNRYLVIEVEMRKTKDKSTQAWAKCVCDCGTIKWVRLAGLKSGTTKSCGCLCLEILKSKKGTESAQYKHGHWIDGKASPTYKSWRAMMNRCYDPKNNRYEKYGAVGITVVERWHNFENFIKDMGLRPDDSYTLDRIDNSKGYTQENVRWATKSEQAVNRKTTKLFTINNETKCLKHWAKDYNISYQVVYKRIFYWGWDLNKALTKELRVSKETNKNI
jgi:hypothetical protein